MSRIPQLDPTQASGKTQALFDGIKARFGMVPNALRIIGNSPAALESYLGLIGALAGGVLPAKTREQISLAVSELNGCSYCLSSHSVTGKIAGLSQEDIIHARQGTGSDEKADAAVKLARKVSAHHGKIEVADLDEAREAGLNDAELVEVVANVIAITFTNFMNNVTDPVVDFPVVKPGIPRGVEALASAS
jgi:uncharacterized peroxidase-related enzyme